MVRSSNKDNGIRKLIIFSVSHKQQEGVRRLFFFLSFDFILYDWVEWRVKEIIQIQYSLINKYLAVHIWCVCFMFFCPYFI